MPNIYLIIFLFSKDSINISNKKISIDINIFIHFQLYFYPLMFYRMGRYCLPDSCFLLVCDPETSSRVTLTLLGTGFQPDLLFGCLVVWLFVKSVCDNVYQQDNKTTKPQDNKTTRSLLEIPSHDISHRPCGLKVEATSDGIDIEHLSGKVETGIALRFHCLDVDFRQ